MQGLFSLIEPTYNSTKNVSRAFNLNQPLWFGIGKGKFPNLSESIVDHQNKLDMLCLNIED